MPETSLRAYFTKLDNLLSVNAADEVIHHCRHILHYFPKHVTAYRLMGRALVNVGRWDEGREVLRRVLSVIPDDYSAHLGLSEANERMDRPDEAIWHLERAFEQRPNDKELIDALRGLYRRYRQVENLKIQLTSAAVARQYLRSGAYSQAIETLRSALARMTDRLDLRLLLAHILWQQGSEEEAAEIALDVLKVLPDCLEANRIMAQLWLNFGRPSDAQRYVNHLESVDPYLAVEIVQGFPPEEDAFRLEELDYERSSQSEMTAARPDWLQAISETPSAPEAPAEQGDEWSNWASAMLKQSKPAEQQVSNEPPKPTSVRFAQMADAEPEQPKIMTSGLTDLFGSVDEGDADELSELFEDRQAPEESDPMAWLRETGVEIVDEDESPAFADLFGDEDINLPEAEENPLAWMATSSADLLVEEAGEADTLLEEEDPFAWMQNDDEEENVVGITEPSLYSYGSPPSTQEEDDSPDLLEDDLLAEDLLNEAFGAEALSSESTAEAWELPDDESIFGNSIESAEQGEAVEAVSQPSGAPRGLTAILKEANFDWSNKQDEPIVSDDEMDEWLNQFGPTQPRTSVTDTPDWLTTLDQPEEADDDEVWLSEPEPDQSVPVGSFQVDAELADLVWMDRGEADDEEDTSDWLAEFAPEQAESSTDDFAWMTDEALAQPEVETAAIVTDEELARMTEKPLGAPEDGDDEPVAGEIPDWMSELEPQDDDSAVTEPQLDAEADDDELDWLYATPEGDEAEEGAVTADIPDWMSELEPQEAAASITEPQVAAEVASTTDDDFDWLNDAAVEDEDEAVAAEIPDWMSELETQAAGDTEIEPESELVTGEIPDWMSELEPAAETVSEPQVTTEAASADEDFDWLNDAAAEDEGEAVEAAEIPDWMSELEPTAETVSEPQVTTEAASEDEDFDWLNDAVAEDEGEAVEAAEIPDWMSELEPAAETVSEPQVSAEVASTTDEDFDWLNDAVAEVEDEAVEAAEIPDWMSELEPTAETVSEPQITNEIEASTDLDWLNAPTAEVEPEFEVEAEQIEWEGELPTVEEVEEEAVAADVPDWMAELEPETLAEPQVSPEATVSDDFSWLEEADQDEAVAAEVDAGELVWGEQPQTIEEVEEEAVAADVPDWMAELEPLELSDESTGEVEGETDQEQEAVAVDEYGWMNEPTAVAEEEAEAVAAEVSDWVTDTETPEAEPATVAAETDFDWLNDAAPDQLVDEEAALEPVAFDAYDEIADSQSEHAAEHEGEVLEPSPAQNAPDWLNAMVPGLDVDYDASDEAVAEVDEAEVDGAAADEPQREFAWLVEMVEEETGAVAPVSFAFSHLPAWIEPSNPAAGASGDDDDFPDWPTDDADADVPEWLR